TSSSGKQDSSPTPPMPLYSVSLQEHLYNPTPGSSTGCAVNFPQERLHYNRYGCRCFSRKAFAPILEKTAKQPSSPIGELTCLGCRPDISYRSVFFINPED